MDRLLQISSMICWKEAYFRMSWLNELVEVHIHQKEPISLTKLINGQLVYFLIYQKNFEKIKYNQVNKYMEPIQSKLITELLKKNNAQHSLSKILQNFKEDFDKYNSLSAIFKGKWRALDLLNHDLLIPKLKAYDFFAKSLSFMNCYLNKRLQKTNVNYEFWEFFIWSTVV